MRKNDRSHKKVADLKSRMPEKVKGGIDTVPLPERPVSRTSIGTWPTPESPVYRTPLHQP